MDSFMSTVFKLLGWKETELSIDIEDDIPRAHMVTISIPKSVVIATGKLLRLLITRSMNLHMALWRVFRSKEEGTSKLLMTWMKSLPRSTKESRSLQILKGQDRALY